MPPPAGAIRGLLQLPGVEEEVALIGIHHRGKLYELNPRDSELAWEVDPWGRCVSCSAAPDGAAAALKANSLACDTLTGHPCDTLPAMAQWCL